MKPLDYSIVVAYLVGVTALGLLASRRRKNSLDEYFLGGRSIPWFVSAASLIATGISCRSLIGMPGLTFGGDLTYLQLYLPLPFMVLIAAVIFLPFYVRHRMTSVYEYIGIRFGNIPRSFASILFQIQTALITGTVIAAPSLVLAEVTGLPYGWSVGLLLFLTLLYTAVGGTKAIVWTDLAQLTIFAGVPIAICIYIIAQADGGFAGLWKIAGDAGKLRTLDFSLDGEVTFWSALLSMSCFHLAQFSVNQENSQRYLTAPSESGCKKAMVWGSVGILLIWALLLVLGVLLFSFNAQRPGIVPAGASPDRIFPAFVLSTLPPGFRGFFVAAALAAGMATLASMVNAMGTAALLDIWKLHFDDNAKESRWVQRARVLTIAWGVLSFAAAFIVLQFGTVITAGIKISAVLIGVLFGMFVLGMTGRRATGRDAMVGAIAGILALLVVIGVTRIPWSWYCVIATAVTVGTGWISSRLLSPPAAVRLEPEGAR